MAGEGRKRMRKLIVAGNWKMYLTLRQAGDLARDLTAAIEGKAIPVDIAVCPSHVALTTVASLLKSSGVLLGAQDMHWEEAGAFTGCVSGQMLQEAGCTYVILGHSELRAAGESDEAVNLKLQAALKLGLLPIVCVGEKLSERESGRAAEVVSTQVTRAFADVSREALAHSVITIAYEPVWAIGTGIAANPQEANEMQGTIRQLFANLVNEQSAEQVRILYGGSVNTSNAAEFLAQPDVDGLLVGKASASADTFLGILEAASRLVGQAS